MNNVHPKGFTLIEVILVILLTAILGSAAALGFSPVLDSWTLGSVRTETTSTLTYSLQRMVGEVSQMKDNKSLIEATATKLQFIDVSGNNVAFQLTGDQLMRNNDVLERDVQGLSFVYRGVDNQIIINPVLSPSETDLWRVEIVLTGHRGNQTMHFSSEVHPRNLPRL